MPKVPVLDNGPVQLENVAPRLQADPNFGRAQLVEAQQNEAIGKGLQGVGQEMTREAVAAQILNRESTVKDADAGFMGDLLAIQHGTPDAPDSGYLSKQGGDAVSLRKPTEDAIAKALQKRMDALPDDASRKMFSQVATIRAQQAVATVQDHYAQQTKVYNAAASETRIKVASDSAATAYNPLNPASQAQYLDTVRGEAEHLADVKGITDPDLRKELVRGKMEGAYVGTISHLLDNKATPAARDYFDRVKGELGTETRDKVQKVLQVAGDKDQALALALEVKSRVKNIGDQEKELDTMFKDGKINADAHEMALQKLRADNAQRRSEETEQDKNMLGSVWALKKNNPNASVADLSVNQIAYIKQRGLGQHVDSILKSDGVADDFKLFNDLSKMAADDPVKFSKQDLTLVSGNLSSGHRDHLLTLQTSINKQDLKAMEANKLVQDTIHTVKSSMVSSGMNLNPKPNTEAAKQLESFTTQLHDAIVTAQNAKGAPLTREEARNTAMGMLRDQALAGTGMFGFFKSHKPAYQMTPEERAKPWEVPEADKVQIMQSLQRAALPATDENIQRAYKLKNGVQ